MHFRNRVSFFGSFCWRSSQAVAVAATTRHPLARMITLTQNRPTLFESNFTTALSHFVTKMHGPCPVCFARPQAEIGYFFGSFWWEERPGSRGDRHKSSASSTNDNTDGKSIENVIIEFYDRFVPLRYENARPLSCLLCKATYLP